MGTESAISRTDCGNGWGRRQRRASVGRGKCRHRGWLRHRCCTRKRFRPVARRRSDAPGGVTEDRSPMQSDHHDELFWNHAIDPVGVGLAAFGFLNPILAALIHVTSELAFILNSARLVSASDLIGPLTTARGAAR